MHILDLGVKYLPGLPMTLTVPEISQASIAAFRAAALTTATIAMRLWPHAFNEYTSAHVPHRYNTVRTKCAYHAQSGGEHRTLR